MATDDLSPAQWALLAVESGWSATAGLDRFRAEGGHIANQTWYRMSAEIARSLGSRIGTYNEPVNRVPTPAEVQDWTTQKAAGYIQQVEVLARDKVTGEIISIPFSLTGRTLVSRAKAMKAALDVYGSDNERKYAQQILGAIYTGTYRAVPQGE